MTRSTTIRRSLITNLVALVAITGGTILAVSWITARRAVNTVAFRLIEQSTAGTALQLDRYADDVLSALAIVAAWTEAGIVDPTDHQRLNTGFVPLLQRQPYLSSLMVANSDGDGYMLLRDPLDPDRWTNRISRAEAWDGRVLMRTWNNATGETTETEQQVDYDPRTRLWYREATDAPADDPVAWSRPVIFFTTKDPGITASVRVDPPETGAPSFVIGVDLLLLDVSRFTSNLDISENGRAFVLVESGDDELRVVGLPRDDRWKTTEDLRNAIMFVPPESAVADTEARLPRIGEIDQPFLTDAIDAWRDGPNAPGVFRFNSAGDPWVGGLKRYQLGQNTFWIGVALPRNDLLGHMVTQRIIALAFIGVVLVVGVARAFMLAKQFSAPIEQLVADTTRISEGDLEPREPMRTPVAEFQRLVEAQEHLRQGISAMMTLDKVERDLDIARDIQAGLLPGEQPNVDGFEIAGWSQPADKAGGDYYDWHEMPDGRWAVSVADVTGHGIGPALVAAVCRAYARASLPLANGLSETLSRINELVEADLPGGRFVTFVTSIIDPVTGTIELISAGHGPLYLYNAADDRVDAMDAHTVPLGVLAEIGLTPFASIRMQTGDILVLLTDGFFEWANAAGEQFGTERLGEAIRAETGPDPVLMIDRIRARLAAFVGNTEQPDDLTIVIIRRDR